MFIFYIFPIVLSAAFISPQLQQLVLQTKGQRIGLITNPTGVDDDLVMVTDKIGQYSYIQKFFAPEHGLRGDQQAGATISDYIDPVTGISVISIYGSKKAPSSSDLADIDVLVYYIRDVGTRFYTFIWTMTYCMEAAQKAGVKFIVVDVPNPLGRTIEGCRNEMDAGIVGRKFGDNLGLPQRYGMTIGELALFVNSEWLGTPVQLEIVPYQKNTFTWILPSPNMPTENTAIVYPGFGIFEGTDLSEGRGTTRPFEIIGSPQIQPEKLASDLNKLKLKGVVFRPLYFTPTFSKHANVLCGGVQIHVTDSTKFEPFKSAVLTLELIMKDVSIKFNGMIEYETGLKGFVNKLQEMGGVKLLDSCVQNTELFRQQSMKYYIY